MYCLECGKVISDKSKFCRYCGAVIEPEETIASNNRKAASAVTDSQPKVSSSDTSSVTANKKSVTASTEKQEKRKEKLTFSDAIVLVVFVVIMVIICYSCDGLNMASCLMSDKEETNTTSSTKSMLPVAESDPMAYNALFDDINTIHPYMINNTASYANKDADGMITCIDISYNDEGVVDSMFFTQYVNTKGLTESEIAGLINIAREADADFVGVECVDIIYDKGNGYFSRRFSVDSVDTEEGRSILKKVGYEIDEEKYIGAAVVEKDLIADGFIRR